ncbi:Fic/DOC family protein [Fusobacterium periodonticum]|uniref:protein adenylyltransferase n=1 Tax=Fusobacterium periodonticum ATCC 33693 TaxID=546275 RepID=D4CRS1_9FUSO|nr:Fic family protein [Fusobacterium periodonticum]EFE87970.1 Fic family protein [Fusobacterium periodonticum ATCC 33693]
MQDPYVYPGTEILINKYGIKNYEELIEIEKIITSSVWQDISEGKIKINKTFDYKHLKSLHRELFKEIYEWAGKERTVDISKAGTLFCRAMFIEEEANRIFSRLKKDNFFKDIKDKMEFSEKLGQVFLDINMLHPFREGNGRSQRLFISDLARENGYDLEWENISKEIMIEISRNDNIKETAEIFEKNLKEINQTIEKIRRKK